MLKRLGDSQEICWIKFVGLRSRVCRLGDSITNQSTLHHPHQLSLNQHININLESIIKRGEAVFMLFLARWRIAPLSFQLTLLYMCHYVLPSLPPPPPPSLTPVYHINIAYYSTAEASI